MALVSLHAPKLNSKAAKKPETVPRRNAKLPQGGRKAQIDRAQGHERKPGGARIQAQSSQNSPRGPSKFTAFEQCSVFQTPRGSASTGDPAVLPPERRPDYSPSGV